MSSSKLPLVALLVILAGVVTFMMMQGDDNDPVGILPVANDSVEPESPAEVADKGSENRTAQPREAAAARTALPSATEAPELDPELQAEMAGFEGRVLHHDGTPAGEHRVILYRFDTNGIMGEINDVLSDEVIDPDVDAGEAMTDVEGRFKISGVWPRSVYLLYAGVGGENPTAKVVERTPRNREVIDLGDIYLRDGAIVTGIIVDEDEAPIAGALVRIVDLPPQIMQMVPIERFDPEGAIIVQERQSLLVLEMPSWVKKRFDQLPLPAALTAADGSFRVTGIEPGNNNVVVATKRGLLSVIRPGIQLKAGKEKDLGSLRMELGEEVYGSVTDASGDPIAGAEILIAQGGAVGEVHFSAPPMRSSADGSFTAAGFKTGKVIAAARRRPGDPWVISNAQSVMRDLNIVLSQGHNLTVRLNSTAGRPIENVELDLFPGRSNDGAIVMKRFGFSKPVATEDNLEILPDGRYRFTDIPAGDYQLIARAPGHAVGGQQIKLTAHAETTLQLEPESGLMVRATQRNGTPIRSVMIYVETRGERRQQVGDMPIPAGRTDSDGRIAVAGVTRGTFRLSARHPRYGWVHADANIPGPEVHLIFDEPGSIVGVLTEKGQVPDPAKWTLVAQRSGQRGAMPEMPKMTMAGAEGAFEMTGLQPGEYRIEVIESLQKFSTPGSFMQSMVMGGRLAGMQQQTYIVASGQTTHVSLDTEKGPTVVDGPSGRISGTMMVNGLPAEGMAVTGWSNGRVHATVDASGQFDLGQVRVGHIYLEAMDPKRVTILSQGSLWSNSVQVEENKDHTLNINIQTGSLTGMVIAPDGSPATGTQVRVRGQIAGQAKNSGTAHFNAISDENGQFEFDQVPAGKFNITAEHEQLGSGYVETFDLTTGPQRRDVRLEATVVVTGHLDRKSLGENITYCWLTFQAESGNGDQKWTQLGEDGTFQVDNLIPGSYHATVWVNYDGSPGAQFEQTARIQVGTGGLDGITLHMQKIVPKPQTGK